MAEITKVKPGTLTDFGDGFHHIRGSFKLGGVVDLGTHCALVEPVSYTHLTLPTIYSV